MKIHKSKITEIASSLLGVGSDCQMCYCVSIHSYMYIFSELFDLQNYGWRPWNQTNISQIKKFFNYFNLKWYMFWLAFLNTLILRQGSNKNICDFRGGIVSSEKSELDSKNLGLELTCSLMEVPPSHNTDLQSLRMSSINGCSCFSELAVLPKGTTSVLQSWAC